MKELSIKLLFVLLLFSACKKTEIIQPDLKGTIKGSINTLNEYGVQNYDNEDILIQLEGSEPLMSTKTDSKGNYELSNIPMGTYNIVVSKEGYCEIQSQGVQIVGGDNPLYFSYNIIEKSSITIENISLEIVNNEIHLKGIINHNFTFDEWSMDGPKIGFYLKNDDNLSYYNYSYVYFNTFQVESGTQFETQLIVNKSLFPSGSTIYVITYGCYENYYGYFDVISGLSIYMGLGEPSNIANIVVP